MTSEHIIEVLTDDMKQIKKDVLAWQCEPSTATHSLHTRLLEALECVCVCVFVRDMGHCFG